MDKIKIINLGHLPESAETHHTIGGAEIIVKRRIPYEEMIDAIQFTIDNVVLERPFISAPLEKIVMDFAILKYFTNFDLDFVETCEDIHEIYAAYDFIDAFGVMDIVTADIDDSQLAFFQTTTTITLRRIMEYRNSAKGMVDELARAAALDSAQIEQALSELKGGNAQKIVEILNAGAEMPT